ncbi:hypothetical protein TSUD_36610 [Trifolium subterraneum]|uniref:Sirohydrochlorin ferrochelatase n=1 Tax=Trifolium subterraneum TaxID=3900 RepID=A0A2Z6PH62_TRISU|nr:hypothetical protein TSUD_36610 [Trifolium subterraneum]
MLPWFSLHQHIPGLDFFLDINYGFYVFCITTTVEAACPHPLQLTANFHDIKDCNTTELADPSIEDAFQSCVQQGARRVIISPFFLSPGRHWSQDIPSLSAEAAKQHPGVSYIVTAPLGLHELLVDVVNDRINYCLKHVAGDADECSVCAGTGKCILHQ